MPVLDDKSVYDGFYNLAAGVDGGRLSSLIDENQCVEAENAVFRGAAPENRPPFRDVALTFENPNLTYNPDGSFLTVDGTVGASKTAFQDGIFQEASYYSPSKTRQHIMVTVGGRQYLFTPGHLQTCSVREIELERRNRASFVIAYHLQAGFYHITQDGEGIPIIYDGSVARRAGPGEIFIGRMMGYGQGRIVLIDNFGFVNFGDLRDSKGGGDTDLLGMTEQLFLNEGFASAIPSAMGSPTGVQFIPQQDTATGVGECFVSGENGIESFFVSQPREQWKDSGAFQKTALLGIGNVGHRSMGIFNEDMWIRSPKDGWRSYRQARAQVNEWSQVPMSTNIGKWIKGDEKSLLYLCSVIPFGERLIATSSPYPNQGRPYHNGLVSLDFNILSTFGKNSNPAWDGHWSNWNANALTGLKVTRLVEGIFEGKQRAFMFVIDANGKNAMREIMPEPVGIDSEGKITSWVVLRALDFKSPYNEKELYGADLWVDRVTEETDVVLTYRPDQVTEFSEWASDHVSPVGTSGATTDGMVPTMTEGFAPRRKFKKPPDIGDTLNTKRIMRRGYDFQPKIQWIGRARLRKFRARAKQLVEESKGTQ